MEKSILILAIGVFGGMLAYHLPRWVKRWRINREAALLVARLCPGARSLPLSREDKRGWETGPDGVFRPRYSEAQSWFEQESGAKEKPENRSK